MTKLNDPGSTVRIANTGNPSKIMVPKAIVGAILVPAAYAVSAANCATSALFLAEMAHIAINPAATRGYPIGPFTDMTPKGEEDVYVKSNYGVSTFVREGKVGWNFAITAGGLGLQKALRSFNQTKAHKLLIYDAENTVFGVDDGAGGMKGFEIEDFQAKVWQASDGSKPAGFAVDILLANPKELADDIIFIKLASSVTASVKGIIDLQIERIGSSSSHAFVRVFERLSGVNVYSHYSTALAAAAVWYADDAGVEATISTVTAVPATESFDLALTVAATTRLQLETPSVLDAANIGGPPDNGFESNAIDITTGAEVDATR